MTDTSTPKRRRADGEGSISFHAGSGLWMGRISLGTSPTGKRLTRTVYADTKKKASKELRKLLAEKEAGKRIESNVPTLAEYVKDWQAAMQGNLKASTRGFYADNLANHIVPALGRKPLNEVRKRDVVRLITELRQDKQLGLSTVRGVLRTLSTVLAAAVVDEWIDANVALQLGKRYLRQGDEPAHEPDPMSTDECQRLLAAARDHFGIRWWAFVMCGLWTGARLGELIGLEWGDLDWHAQTIRIARNIVRGRLTTPKSHQQRTLKVSPVLLAALREHQQHLSAWCLEHGLPVPDAMFPSMELTRLDDSNVRKTFTAICKKAGIRARHPHDMRDTFASMLLSRNESVRQVAELLGHKNASTTLTHYDKYIPKRNDDYTRVLDEIVCNVCVATEPFERTGSE